MQREVLTLREAVPLQRGVVIERGHLRSGQLRGRIVAEARHHGLDLFGATLALLHHGDVDLLRVSVFAIDLLEQLVERQAAILGPSRDLSQHAAGGDGVLVAHKVLAEEAVALLAAADVLLLALVAAHDVSDPLEARVDVVHLHAVALGDGADRLRGDDRLDDVLLALQSAHLLPAREEVVDEEDGRLIAIEQDPLAVVVLHGRAHAVSVRVGGKHQFGVRRLGPFYG